MTTATGKHPTKWGDLRDNWSDVWEGWHCNAPVAQSVNPGLPELGEPVPPGSQPTGTANFAPASGGCQQQFDVTHQQHHRHQYAPVMQEINQMVPPQMMPPQFQPLGDPMPSPQGP